MNNALLRTDFRFPGHTKFYRGKVRDVYHINDELLVMIATDRISAFDVVLPRGIPYKGQVLNQIAAHSVQVTNDIVPNWIIDVPDPMVSVGYLCTPFKVEMVVRGFLAGHAWREYNAGKRTLSGVPMPDGLRQNDPFSKPIITPSTKAEEGHDEDISREKILETGLVSEADYLKLEEYSHALFRKGSELAEKTGLILVDTKYEFGKRNGDIYLIDEVHTPDSSRYFYRDGYEERQRRGEPQKQLSKEFVREWLMENGFQGKAGQQIPLLNDEFVSSVSERYIELYEKLTATPFVRSDLSGVMKRVEENVLLFLNNSKFACP